MHELSCEHLPTTASRHTGHARDDAAVLDATLAELAERGYEATSLSSVAQRAQIGRETIFGAWHSKQHLVHAAINRLASRQPTPDTGALRADLLQTVEALVEVLNHPGTAEMLRSLIAVACDQTAAAVTLRVGLLAERRAVVRRLIERGQRREMFPVDVHPAVAADAIIGPLCLRRLITGEPLTADVGVQTVDLVLGTYLAARHSPQTA
jgi:AcrR family transcriptional regulator